MIPTLSTVLSQGQWYFMGAKIDDCIGLKSGGRLIRHFQGGARVHACVVLICVDHVARHYTCVPASINPWAVVFNAHLDGQWQMFERQWEADTPHSRGCTPECTYPAVFHYTFQVAWVSYGKFVTGTLGGTIELTAGALSERHTQIMTDL